MIRKSITAVLLAVSLAAPVGVLAASPANAAGEKCVKRSEYRQVKKGMAKKRVHAIFDSAGVQTFATSGYESRDYKPCSSPQYGFVTVNYDHGKVDSKFVYWG